MSVRENQVPANIPLQQAYRNGDRAEDRFMIMRSQRQTSTLGRDLQVDMCALVRRLSDRTYAAAILTTRMVGDGGTCNTSP